MMSDVKTYVDKQEWGDPAFQDNQKRHIEITVSKINNKYKYGLYFLTTKVQGIREGEADEKYECLNLCIGELVKVRKDYNLNEYDLEGINSVLEQYEWE